MSRRVVFLGPPGAGKGTQARELALEWGVPHLATGDMLREAVAAGSQLGLVAKRHMDAGELVPDGVIIDLMRERLGASDARKGFIVDGFPRTVAQAEALAKVVEETGQGLGAVIFFEVCEAELLRRLTGRRICRRCQATYHVVSAPPAKAGTCDKCQGQLYQRDDDTEATVRNRLDVYRRQTEPLLEYYRERDLLRAVAGEGPIDGIRQSIRDAAGVGR